jgi:cell division protein FtsL
LVVVSLLGLGRVWLSVQAAEASMKANVLRSSIKTERYEGDMLEVSQSALGSPSRIRAIASTTMQMTSSRKVTYLRLDADAASAHLSEPRPVARRGANGTLARMMDLTAGEAQVLLVGSIGLASPK